VSWEAVKSASVVGVQMRSTIVVKFSIWTWKMFMMVEPVKDYRKVAVKSKFQRSDDLTQTSN